MVAHPEGVPVVVQPSVVLAVVQIIVVAICVLVKILQNECLVIKKEMASMDVKKLKNYAELVSGDQPYGQDMLITSRCLIHCTSGCPAGCASGASGCSSGCSGVSCASGCPGSNCSSMCTHGCALSDAIVIGK